MSHKDFLERPLTTYSQARYLMSYLYQKDLLLPWYEAYARTYEQDATGRLALEEVLGRPLDRIEADWRRWVLALPDAAVRVQPNQSYLGVRVSPVSDGLRIAQTVPRSGAALAGLREGDVILDVAGRRVVESHELIGVVTSFPPGEVVQVRLRRGEEYLRVPITLTAMPSRGPQSPPPRRGR